MTGDRCSNPLGGAELHVMSTEQRQPDSPPLKRRFFRYSLRTLMLVVTVFCVWLGVTAKRARDQRSAVEVIEALGGEVEYEHEPKRTPYEGGFIVWGNPNTVNRAPPGPEWLRGLIGDEYFFSVRLVRLSRTTTDDASLAAVARFADMKSLLLDDTRVSDAGLEHLKGLVNLRELNVIDTLITDAGLEHLRGLTSLRLLQLQHTKVTEDSARDLAAALPECTIIIGSDLRQKRIKDGGSYAPRSVEMLFGHFLHQLTIDHPLPHCRFFRDSQWKLMVKAMRLVDRQTSWPPTPHGGRVRLRRIVLDLVYGLRFG